MPPPRVARAVGGGCEQLPHAKRAHPGRPLVLNAEALDEVDFEAVGRMGSSSRSGALLTGPIPQCGLDGCSTGICQDRFGIGCVASERIVFVNGREIAEVRPDDAPRGFPSTPQKPYFDLWVANDLDSGWAGRWSPLRSGERLTMRLHGYRAAPWGD